MSPFTSHPTKWYWMLRIATFSHQTFYTFFNKSIEQIFHNFRFYKFWFKILCLLTMKISLRTIIITIIIKFLSTWYITFLIFLIYLNKLIISTFRGFPKKPIKWRIFQNRFYALFLIFEQSSITLSWQKFQKCTRFLESTHGIPGKQRNSTFFRITPGKTILLHFYSSNMNIFGIKYRNFI